MKVEPVLHQKERDDHLARPFLRLRDLLWAEPQFAERGDRRYLTLNPPKIYFGCYVAIS